MRDLVSNQGGGSEKGHPRSSSGLPKHPQVDPEGGRAEEKRGEREGEAGEGGRENRASMARILPFLPFLPSFPPLSFLLPSVLPHHTLLLFPFGHNLMSTLTRLVLNF